MSDVPEGYRMSEVGVIPWDWDVKELGEITDIDPDNLSNSTNPEYSFQYISLEDVDCGTLKNTTELLFKNAPSRARRKIRKDDILLSTVRPNLKSHLLLKKEISNWICSTGFSVVRCKDNIAHSCFVFNHLFSSVIDRQIETLITGSNYPAINSKDVKSLLIPIPPTIEEQQAIASALSDTDALITALEQLIAKKRNVKQGVMQQLLTGEKRLPGFSGDWEIKKLGELGELKNGINKGKEDFGFGYSFVNLLDVFGRQKLTQGSSIGLVNSSSDERKIYELRKGDVLFIRSSVKPEGVGLTSLVNDDLKDTVYSGFLIRFRDFGKLYFEYKAYCFNEEGFRKKVIDSSTVSANTNINQDALKNLQIKFPSFIEEQQAIAQILSDMDTEIETLEQKQAKYKAIKQGMMQELLTGKTRLV